MEENILPNLVLTPEIIAVSRKAQIRANETGESQRVYFTPDNKVEFGDFSNLTCENNVILLVNPDPKFKLKNYDPSTYSNAELMVQLRYLNGIYLGISREDIPPEYGRIAEQIHNELDKRGAEFF